MVASAVVSAAALGEEEVALATEGGLATAGASEAALEATEVGMVGAQEAASDTRAMDSAAAHHLRAPHLARVEAEEVGLVVEAAMAVVHLSMALYQMLPTAVGMVEAAADPTIEAAEIDSAAAATGIQSASANRAAAAIEIEIATVGTVAAGTTTPESERTKEATAVTKTREANEGTRVPPHLHLRHSNFRKTLHQGLLRVVFSILPFQ